MKSNNTLIKYVLNRKYQILDNPVKGDRYVYKYGRCEELFIVKGKWWDITRLEWDDLELHASARRSEVKLMQW